VEIVIRLLAYDVLKPLTIDFEAMQVAFEDQAGEGRWFLDVETGTVIRTGEQAGARYIEIPYQGAHARYRDMAEFIRSVNDNRLRALLDAALQGNGTSRRFEDVLRDVPEEHERWLAFQRGCAAARIRRWLQSVGMVPVARVGTDN
jgi:hypothetical protein